MPKFTFQLPSYDYDSFEVTADNVDQASDVLHSFIKFGQDKRFPVELVDTSIGADPQYHEEDAYDCVVLDEEGEQIR